MSESSQGPGWWQASDLKWYPPEERQNQPSPDVLAHAAERLGAPAPSEPPPPPPPPPTAPTGSNSRWIVIAVAAVALVAVIVFLVANGGGDDKQATGSTRSSESFAPPPTQSTVASAELTEADLQARLLTVAELGEGLTPSAFARNTEPILPCGTPNPDATTPPTVDVGVAGSAAGVLIQEELVTYPNATATQRAFDQTIDGYECAEGTLSNSSGTQAVTFVRKDLSSHLGVDQAVEIDFTTEGFHGQIFLVRTPRALVGFSFAVLDTVNPSTVPDPVAIVQKGLEKAKL